MDGKTVPHFDRARHGLTLVELLVVMAIMTIIASAITVAAIGAYANSQVKGTRNFFEKISAAMAQYRDIHRMNVALVVRNDPGVPSTSSSTYDAWRAQSSCGLWQALEYEGIAGFSADPKFKEKWDAFANPQTGEKTARFRYVDAWRNPILYLCPPPYASFELRSAGKDLEWNTEDDIVLSE